MDQRRRNDAEALVQALRGPIARFLGRVVTDPEVREEALSETILVLLQRRALGRSPRRQLSFAFRVAWNKACDLSRRRSRHCSLVSAEQVPAPDAGRATELREWILAAFACLPSEERALLTLWHEEGLTHRQIAKVLGIPAGSVAARLRRGEEALRVRLRERGDGLSLPLAMALLPLALDRGSGIGLITTASVKAAVGTSAAAAIPTLFIGGFIMKKSALVLGLLLLAAGGWWVLTRDEAMPRPDLSEQGAVVAPTPRDGGDGGPPAPTPRSETMLTARFEGEEAGGKASPVPPAGREATEILGLVVDGQRRPVTGATVRFLPAEGVALEATTDSAGAFSFAAQRCAGDWELGSLHAHHPEHGVAVQGVDARVGLRTVNLEPLVLQPGYPLDVRVVRDGVGVARSSVHLIRRNESTGSAISLGASTADGEGCLDLGPVPQGRYVIRVRTPDGDAASRVADVPLIAAGPLVVDVTTACTLEVAIVDARTEEPLEGVWLEIWERLSYGQLSHGRNGSFESPVRPGSWCRTDERGLARVDGLLPDTRVTVRPRADGYPEPWISGWRWSSGSVELEPGRNTLRLEMTPYRTMRWPLRAGTGPVPAEGTVVRFVRDSNFIGGRPPPPEGRIVDGHLVADSWPADFGGGQAVAADGSVASVFAPVDSDLGRPITFATPVWLEVVVREEGGDPVSGLLVQLQRGFGRHMDIYAASPTDADGLARLGPFVAGGGDVALVPEGARLDAWGHVIGQPDWSRNPARLEVRLGPEVEVTAHVFRDGVPGLPPTYRFSCSHPRALLSRPEEDPLEGRLRFSVRFPPATKALDLEFQADGYVPQHIGLVRPEEQSTITTMIRLDGGVQGVVRVHLPPDGVCELFAKALSPSPGSGFGDGWRIPLPLAPGIGGAVHAGFVEVPLRGLDPARTFVIDDGYSGLSSKPFEVAKGGPPVHVELDLRDTSWVGGTVLVPPQHDVSEAKVLVRGRGFQRTQAVDPAGRFRVRITGDRKLRISPSHDLLSPHPDRGSVEGEAFPDEVTLELIESGSATIRLDRKIGGPVRIRLFQGVPGQDPLWESALQPPDPTDIITFAGFPAGAVVVWMHVAGFCPLVLEGVDLGMGKVDLGLHALDPGAQIRFTFEGSGPFTPHEILISQLTDPPFTQRAYAHTRRGATVTGLLPGTVKVNVRSAGLAPAERAVQVAELQVAPGEEKNVIVDLAAGRLR